MVDDLGKMWTRRLLFIFTASCHCPATSPSSRPSTTRLSTSNAAPPFPQAESLIHLAQFPREALDRFLRCPSPSTISVLARANGGDAWQASVLPRRLATRLCSVGPGLRALCITQYPCCSVTSPFCDSSVLRGACPLGPALYAAEPCRL